MKRKNNKKYRIKSPLRFITSLIIMAVLATGIIGLVTGINTSVALTKKEPVKVEICAGDTLWTIADRYKSDNTDTRRAVYEICTANDIEASDLQPGMIIEIPAEI